ncbi:MAG TPA: LLM class F420-dependent oxidoreductase [Baekduia sp.]|nr:LLM class F420-dependent oxidoreductase [Baekduia sp.]HMJ32781.1 LLM class F420-dependent oxidoreductase [Baekduia sp.]
MAVRVGVQVQPQHADFDGMRRAWREAEELGVDTIFTWDHFYPLYGEPEGKHFEALTTLASMAEVTEHAQIGALVICNSYRNPELLADAHRTIDHISGGRVILGIGAGWFEKDYDEYGYEFGDAPARLRALKRDLPRIRERLGKLNPPPVGEMPILIGGSGEKVTLRLVAEHANLWHGFGDAATFAKKNEILLGHCDAVGRNPGEIERTWGIQADALDSADDLLAAGVDHLIVGLGGDGKGYDLGAVRELVQWRDGANGRASSAA